MNYTVLDLFAGCGGLSLGLAQAGFDIRWANEIDPSACGTYRASHPNTTLFEEDANILLSRMTSGDGALPVPGEVDLVCGGPPCQGFSGYNRFRNAEDPRNSLVETFLAFVDYLHPRLVLMENVPGMLSLEDGATAHLLLSTLEGLGYNTKLGILQAGAYGIPQNRWRVFVIAAQVGQTLPSFPQPTHLFPRTTVFGATRFRDYIIKPPSAEATLFSTPLPTVTVGDAIDDLPAIENGSKNDELEYPGYPKSDYQKILRVGSEKVRDHITSCLGPIQLERCRAVPKHPGAGWLDLPDNLKPKNLVRYGDERYNNRFGRLHKSGTFNTIVHVPEPYWGAVFHPNQERVISVRECARAQGFPDRVRLYGSMSARYKQVGNAVPPPLAATIGHELLAALNGKKD
jgi:DNA (cytosine-5)-methyltransferase 1